MNTQWVPKWLGQGQSLPPGLLVRTGKWTWTTMWRLMMAQLAPPDPTGAYQRPPSQFRHRIQTGAPTRYQLLVGMSCPWAHRTLVTRALKGLEAVIPVTVVVPVGDAGVWGFATPLNGCSTLPEFYRQCQPGYRGRSTVPVLWDTETGRIVNNESAEVIEILNAAFEPWAKPIDLYPAALKSEIDQWNQHIYSTLNNGVYRCGFAQTQIAYELACTELFRTLDQLEQTLASRRYLCGAQLTLADVRLFTTLIRFDVAYYGLFKCNRRRLQDYPHLSGYLRDLYQQPGVADTCDLAAVKRDYYGNLFPLNPGGIIPLGPELPDLNLPHGREGLGASADGEAA